MARIERAYAMKFEDQGLLNEPDKKPNTVEVKAVVFSEEDARQLLREFGERSRFSDVLKYDRNLIYDGRGIRWTYYDKDDSGWKAYEIYYEECEIVLML